MAELEIRPTMKFIRLGYVAVLALLVAALIWWGMAQDQTVLGGVGAAALLLFWPALRHVQQRRVRCRLDGVNLRYEEGLLSTTTRTIPVSNIQDVTVSRGLMQRLWGVGNLRIETSGDSPAVEIANVDDPQPIADRILAARGLAK
jgi:putative membrane protein